MIELINLQKRYGARVALHLPSLSVAEGELLAIIGPNGSGKSTLLRLLSGVIEPDAGTIADPATEMQSPAERLLAGIWIDLLGVPDVRPDDNFFDLGGHSLLAAAMLARVEKLTRIRLNLLKVANGTLRALASELPADGTAAPSGGVGARLRRLFGRDAQKDPA